MSAGPPYDATQPLFDLVGFSNLYLKFSSVNLYAASRGKSNVREFFSPAAGLLRAARMVWGSNFPATNDRGLKEQYELARNELSLFRRMTNIDSLATLRWDSGPSCASC